MEKKKRTIFKGITYRLLATIASFTLAYFLTGNVGIAVAFGSLDFIIKLSLYYINDRAWSKFTWGLDYSIKRSIISKKRNNAKL
jgi:uncharacterized membrane protein